LKHGIEIKWLKNKRKLIYLFMKRKKHDGPSSRVWKSKERKVISSKVLRLHKIEPRKKILPSSLF